MDACNTNGVYVVFPKIFCMIAVLLKKVLRLAYFILEKGCQF